MLFSGVTGRKVVSTSTAQAVGQVANLIVDPRSHHVVAVTVKKADHGDTLFWDDISSFGPDAVTVAGPEAVHEANDEVKELSVKAHDLFGKRVLSTLGEDLGTLSDVEFDAATGVVETLVVSGREISGSLLISTGSYAVIVHAA